MAVHTPNLFGCPLFQRTVNIGVEPQRKILFRRHIRSYRLRQKPGLLLKRNNNLVVIGNGEMLCFVTEFSPQYGRMPDERNRHRAFSGKRGSYFLPRIAHKPKHDPQTEQKPQQLSQTRSISGKAKLFHCRCRQFFSYRTPKIITFFHISML